MKDLCLNCGKEREPELWGAKCNCDDYPKVVHQMKCMGDGCNNIIGYMGEDDYCGIEELYCHECLNKKRINISVPSKKNICFTVCDCNRWHDRIEESNNTCSVCDKPIK